MANFIPGRIKSLIFYPGYEWKIIAAEKRSLKEDFFQYAMVLILFGAAARALGSFFFVRNVLDIDAYRFSLPITQALAYLLMQVITVLLLTFMVNGMAKKFNSDKDFVKAGKLVIYSLTPLFICYILVNLNRHLVLAFIPALYSIWLLSGGLPALLKTPGHRVPAFIFIIFLSALSVNYLLESGFAYLTTLLFPDVLTN
jgi:hypothetical protein